jgi:L-2,4-diaminobutyric acid acetyltransferase
MSETRSNRVGGGVAMTDRDTGGVTTIEPPHPSDGAALWRIAKDSATLDLNSSYAYLLWCRDFSDTSVVARIDGAPVGFVTGYLRPASTDTLMVWQVAVDDAQRGAGLAGALLDNLLGRVIPAGVRYLETTVTADNTASNRMFDSLAGRWSARCSRTELFGGNDFPDGHKAEFLYRIGPFQAARRDSLS